MNAFFTLMKPELALTAIIFLLLLLKLGKPLGNDRVLLITRVLLLLNLVLGFTGMEEGTLFGGSYHSSLLIVYQKNLLNAAVLLVSYLFSDWFRQSRHTTEFFILMLSSLLGMFFLLSSGNLLMFYLALELASIPAAALVNFDLENRQSSEGAMKMILNSAFSSGILLFGISLLYGATGTIDFNQLPAQLSAAPLQVLAFIFLIAAFAFKLSVVPFHLWTADVYQGAPPPAAAFLSVVSKAAFAFIFITILYKVFLPLQEVWYPLLVLLAVITMIVGNLFALRQQHMRRFLAFSSIAQVGFMLIAISGHSADALASVVYFVLVYIFSNLAAFSVAGVLSVQAGKNRIDDYKGLYRSNPFLSWMLALALFSLAGIPPTAGFFGKLFLITAGARESNYVVILLVALNLVISLYYYLRIVKAMFMDEADEPMQPVKLAAGTRAGLWICAAGIVAAGLIGWIYQYILSLC